MDRATATAESMQLVCSQAQPGSCLLTHQDSVLAVRGKRPATCHPTGGRLLYRELWCPSVKAPPGKAARQLSHAG